VSVSPFWLFDLLRNVKYMKYFSIVLTDSEILTVLLLGLYLSLLLQ